MSNVKQHGTLIYGVRPVPKELRELVLSYRDYYGTYHHHKEQMAYTAAALYLALSAAVVGQPSTVWEWKLPGSTQICLLVLSATAGFVFVIWQLRNREFAAKMVLACSAILARWPTEPTQSPATNPTPAYNGIMFPKIIVDELDQIDRNRGGLKGPSVSAAITYVLMALWSLAAAVSLYCAT